MRQEYEEWAEEKSEGLVRFMIDEYGSRSLFPEEVVKEAADEGIYFESMLEDDPDGIVGDHVHERVTLDEIEAELDTEIGIQEGVELLADIARRESPYAWGLDNAFSYSAEMYHESGDEDMGELELFRTAVEAAAREDVTIRTLKLLKVYGIPDAGYTYGGFSV
jgi:hypothetical protein